MGDVKDEAEVAYLEVEQTSLVLEIGATKDEVSSLQSISHGGGLPEGLGADLCLQLRMLYVQTQHLWRLTKGSRWNARLL